MTAKERYAIEEKILSQLREIGESIRDITPEKGHLSLTWYPDGHMDVVLFGGETVNEKDGKETVVMILDAWAETEDGKLKVHRV